MKSIACSARDDVTVLPGLPGLPGSPGLIIELTAISKDYHGLRPLRIEKLNLAAGELVAILGLDQPMAETFVNLVTGATLPDLGEVRVFGRPTTAIDDSADWLAVVDRFGIVSDRAVLLDALSVIQNLAIPFTLDIDPPPADVRERAGLLAREVGLQEADWPRSVSELDAAGRLRIRLARALALDPNVLLLEHANAGLPADAVLGAEIRRIALIALTAVPEFAAAVAPRVLTLDPASGRLSERRKKWSLFRRGE
jgi:ABC-type transporter Mla maintaining outer membrane lipid asymmetry ATPase subunit MlaF